MAEKIIVLPERFETGEPTVQLVATFGNNGRILREKTSLGMSKVASSSPAYEYMKTVEPEEGKTIVLVVGMGDHETYGLNRNGDGFPSEPIHGKIAADQVLTKHYQSYDRAHVYEHHVNNDPKKAIGRVKKAFWNPRMRRVEVIEDFDNKKAAHLLEKIAAGEFPAKSMGCRIPYDVCTICGNRAKTRKDYCEHLKFQMNHIMPDGQKVGALNPSVDLFDSSWVYRPADRTGFMLKKVARDSIYEIRTPSYDLGETATLLRQKAAALRKAADIEKVISGNVEAVKSNPLVDKYKETTAPKDAEALPKHKNSVSILVQYSPKDAVGTTDGLGMPMGLRELLDFFLSRMGGKAAEPEEHAEVSKHAADVAELFARYPRFYDDTLKAAGLDELGFNGELAQKLAAAPGAVQMPNRAIHDTTLRTHHPHLGSNFGTQERPNTDTLTYQDPSGQNYVTNVGAARRATSALQSQARGHQIARGAGYLGAGALLGGAGMSALSAGNRMPKRLLGGLGVGAGLMAAGKGLYEAARPTRLGDLKSPMVMTNEGTVIPAYTEMKMAADAGGTWAPEMLHVALRLGAVGSPCASEASPRKLAFERAVREAEVHDELSPILGPTLELEKIALALEQILFAD